MFTFSWKTTSFGNRLWIIIPVLLLVRNTIGIRRGCAVEGQPMRVETGQSCLTICLVTAKKLIYDGRSEISLIFGFQCAPFFR